MEHQVLRGALQKEMNTEVVFLVERTDSEALLVHHGADASLELISHPLHWREASANYENKMVDYAFDSAFKPVLQRGEPYPATEAARKFIRLAIERHAEFRGGALQGLMGALPAGDVHLFSRSGGFIGRFASTEDAQMIAAACRCDDAVTFASARDLQKLPEEDLQAVARALDLTRVHSTKKFFNEVFNMAKAAKKKDAPKVAKAKARQRRADGPVAKARAIFEKMRGKDSADILAACKEAGINAGTATTQLGRWRKENGIKVQRGGARTPKKAAPAKPAKKAAKKAAKKPAKKAAKKPAQTPQETPQAPETAAPDVPPQSTES